MRPRARRLAPRADFQSPYTVRALIFDFDGLILDTETPEVEVWRDVFAELGCVFPDEWWMNAIGRGVEQVLELPEDLLEEQLGHPLDRPAFKAKRRARLLHAIEQQPVMPGVVDLVVDARRNGVTVAIASSSHHDWVDGHLARLGITKLFDHVVCSEDAERGKPFPDLYLEAMRRVGSTPPDTIALEDSPNGIRAAKAAGAFCVVVPNPASSLLDLRHADARLASLADVSIAQLRETMSQPGVVETERLLLAPWRLADAPAAFEIYRDPEVQLHLGNPPVSDLQTQEEILEWVLGHYREYGRGYGFWKVHIRQTGDVVGTAILKPLGDGKVEVGWHLRRDAWGHGYATEAARACIDHALRVLQVPAVYAVIQSANERSLRLATRLGMRRLGTTTEYYDGVPLELFEFRP